MSKNEKPPVCAGAVNSIVARPDVCPRCGATDQDECRDVEARGHQIAIELDAEHIIGGIRFAPGRYRIERLEAGGDDAAF